MILNQDLIAENKASFENVEINILLDGEVQGVLSYEQLLAFEGIEYEAIYDISKTEPVIETYKGVELKTILSHFGLADGERLLESVNLTIK